MRIALIAAIISLLLFASVSAQTAYTISVDPAKPKIIHVEADLTLENDTLYMLEYGADDHTRRWAYFVRDLRGFDSSGKPVEIEPVADDAKWKVSAKGRVKLQYDVVIEHPGYTWPGGIDGIAFPIDSGIFATGRTFLIMNGAAARNIPVTFRLPAGWRATAPWTPVSSTKYIARDLTDLSESLVQLGKHEEFTLKRRGFELVFALSGSGIASQKAAYEKLANGVLDYYINLMGGIPKPPPSRPLKRIVVAVNPGKESDGEVVGNQISIVFDPADDSFSQMISKFIFAHEFFHLWNGKTLNVESSKEDWFKEGVTNYYTLKALVHTGAITREDYLTALSNLFYKRYAADPGYGKLSMRDVASGADKDKHWGLVYGGGLFAGMCQDVGIRRATKNRKSLDDLMRAFYKNYGGTEEVYTTADLQNYLTRLSGRDQSDFFNRHVFGSEPVPVMQCLSDAGLNAKLVDDDLLLAEKIGLTAAGQAILAAVFGK